MINFFKKLDKKIAVYLGIALGIIFLLIILMIVLKISVGTRINSKTFETKLKETAVKYYEKNDDKLPKKNGEKTSISIDDLVDEGYLKNPEKLLKKGLTCSGGVNVNNNNGYYLYQTDIECSDGYNTNLLYKKILKDNKIKTTGDGLYKYNNYYLFRGENLNNYVKFANKNWQILRINNDNTIRLILIDNFDSTTWDDRYNIDKQDSVGKNNYEISRIKQTLDTYFINEKDKLFTNEEKALIVPTELCIGSRNELSTIMDGSIECLKKTEKLPLGLLQANEYTIVSLDPDCKNLFDSQCSNYNFLAKLGTFWTLTPDSKSSYHVYRVSGRMISSIANTYAKPRIVLNISSDALYKSGNGSKNNPYIIK